MTFVEARAADESRETVRRIRARESARERRGQGGLDGRAGITKPPFGMRSRKLGTAGEEKRQTRKGGRRESARFLPYIVPQRRHPHEGRAPAGGPERAGRAPRSVETN